MSPDPARLPLEFRLYGVTDRTQLPEGVALDDWLAVLCWHGLRGVQLREKDLPEPDLERLAVLCRPIFNRHHLQWLVNGSVRVALAADATGVHLPDGADVAAARAALGPERLVGASVHGLDAARRAADAGADFLCFGPVYDTPAKRAFGPPQGLDALRAACAAVPIPVFAVGGLTPERAEDCRRAGAFGAAVVSGLMRTGAADETLAKYEHALGRL